MPGPAHFTVLPMCISDGPCSYPVANERNQICGITAWPGPQIGMFHHGRGGRRPVALDADMLRPQGAIAVYLEGSVQCGAEFGSGRAAAAGLCSYHTVYQPIRRPFLSLLFWHSEMAFTCCERCAHSVRGGQHTTLYRPRSRQCKRCRHAQAKWVRLICTRQSDTSDMHT